MNRQNLKALPNDELLKKLNDSFREDPLAILDLFEDNGEKEEFDSLCAECYGLTKQKRSGDEGITYCSNCRLVEGNTLEVSVIHSLNVAYIWNSKKWVQSDDSMGMEY